MKKLSKIGSIIMPNMTLAQANAPHVNNFK